ncbi:Uncharacterized protein conserved in bacteria [Dermatophilus congolensis]|uniref:Uncharacterized protein conserved in bacteria n=1 Tax=Dermatophilus congolensis TaxID=1863 RepID=A0AA46H1H8_9MICO|nr:Uncharacterized protein conserved in bacteria [Dermatophilus congolensis]
MRWVRGCGWGIVGIGVLVACVSLVDGEQWSFVPLLQALAPALALAAVPVALGLWWISRRQALVMAVVGVALFVPVLGDVVDRQPSVPVTVGQRPSDMLTVLSVNTYFGIEVPTTTVEQVRQLRPDVLVLVEESPTNWQGLLKAGLKEYLPYATGTVGGSSATVVATREPMSCVDIGARARCNEVVDVGSGEVEQFDMPAVRLADGTLFRGVHPWSPRLDPVNRWYRDQVGLVDWVQQRSSEQRLVMAGDFNASRSHPVFRRLLNGMVEAPSGGVPWTRTWPMGWFFPPFVQIDHVVARGFQVAAAGVLPSKVSDHAAVWAQLVRK